MLERELLTREDDLDDVGVGQARAHRCDGRGERRPADGFGGVVVDRRSRGGGEPVGGATVTAVEADLSTRTGADGGYRLGVPDGTPTIRGIGW